MPITVANRTYNFFNIAGTSSSFAIPSTTAGNLLLVLVTNCASLSGDVTTALSDNVGDSFTQVPWYSLAGSNAVAGQMSKFAANAGHGGAAGDCGQFDAWYAITKGSATAINWAISGDVEPEFWVYELTGISGWTLIASGATVSSALQSLPFLGPSMNGTGTDNAYFSMIGGSGAFQSGGTVGGPWSLDPSFQTLAAGQSLAYIVDNTGIQQASFGGADTPDVFVSVGVVFGSSGSSGTITVTTTGVPTNPPGTTTPITVTVTTTGGSPVPGIPVTFTPTTGTVSPPSSTTNSTGTASTVYTAPTPVPSIPVTLTGSFADLTGRPITNGYLSVLFGATSPPITASSRQAPLDNNGSIVGGFAVQSTGVAVTITASASGYTSATFTETVSPLIAGSPLFYKVSVHAADGTLAWKCPHPLSVLSSNGSSQSINSCLNLSSALNGNQ